MFQITCSALVSYILICDQVKKHILLTIIIFANRGMHISCRDWFVAPKSPLELLQIELMAERRLRQVAEEKLSAALNGKRAAERERDLLRVSK